MIICPIICYIIISGFLRRITKPAGIIGTTAFISETFYFSLLYTLNTGIQIAAAPVSVIYSPGFCNIDIYFLLRFRTTIMDISNPGMSIVMIFQLSCHRCKRFKQWVYSISAVYLHCTILPLFS